MDFWKDMLDAAKPPSDDLGRLRAEPMLTPDMIESELAFYEPIYEPGRGKGVTITIRMTGAEHARWRKALVKARRDGCYSPSRALNKMAEVYLDSN